VGQLAKDRNWPQGLPIPSQLERILLQGANMDDIDRTQRDLSEEKQRFLDHIEKQTIEHIASISARERKRRTRVLLTDDLVLQRLAKLIVEQGFRNRLEDIHAGTFPSSKSGDGTDIKVVSPYGEIPLESPGKNLGRGDETDQQGRGRLRLQLSRKSAGWKSLERS
jgi:hypothetical protein